MEKLPNLSRPVVKPATWQVGRETVTYEIGVWPSHTKKFMEHRIQLINRHGIKTISNWTPFKFPIVYAGYMIMGEMYYDIEQGKGPTLYKYTPISNDKKVT